MSNLPTKEEFIKTFNIDDKDIQKYWNKNLFRCPRCNGGVKRDFSVVFNSDPPKYRYFCKDCGYFEIF